MPCSTRSWASYNTDRRKSLPFSGIARDRCRGVVPAKAGIHFSRWNKTLAWVPAFAGTTLQPGFQPGRRFFHTLFRGKDAAVRSLAVPHRGGQHFLRLL